MVDICMMDISKLMDETRFRLAYQLSDFRRQKKCDSIAAKEDKCRCIGAGLLLSYMLQKRDICLKKEEIIYSDAGKPYLKNQTDVFFNLSHSGRFVVCAVADKEVGVDIQKVKSCNMKMAERFFHEEEVGMLKAVCDEEKQNRKFTELFSAKESYAKKKGISAVSVLGKKVEKLAVSRFIEADGETYVLTVV